MGDYVLDKNKYKAAFLYIVNALGSLKGKKKAYKLFYFLDFDYFEAFGKPFTGDVYKALPMGPAPVYLDAIVQELEMEGMIVRKKSRVLPVHENDTVIYESLKENSYPFSKKEKKMLDRIIKLYGNQTGKSLEQLSHAEAPYNAVETFQMIPYDYAIYRDTPDLEAI